MATFNGAIFIHDQILSIIKQLGPDDELIISDNGSADNTIDIIQAFKDTRIKLLHCKQVGVVKNFENALRMASGKYIFLSDQDDIWMPRRVEVMSQGLIKSHLVMSNAIVTNAELNPDKNSCTLFQLIQPSRFFLKNIVKNSFTGCCMAFDRKVLSVALPFPPHLPMHDWWIGLVALGLGGVSFLDTPTLFYRRHGNNTSTLSMSSNYSLFYRFVMRLTILKSLLLRFAILRLR